MSESQRKLLIGFMENDDQLRIGKFTNQFTYKDAQKKWLEITNELNSIPGARKDWTMWRRTWQDLKKNAKKKNCNLNTYAWGTGGGPPIFEEKVLNESDKDILKLNVEESIVNFDHDYIERESNSQNCPQGKIGECVPKNVECGHSSGDLLETASYMATPPKRTKIASTPFNETLKTSQKISSVLEKKSTMAEKYYKEKLALLRTEQEYKLI